MMASGRPRKTSIDQKIIQAMAELVAEDGYARLTVDRVIQRAGTNKPSFYRRYSGLADVVPYVLGSRHGTDEDIDTGSLLGDLLLVQRRQRELFTDPVTTRGFVGWLAECDADPERGQAFAQAYLAPRRAYTSLILGRSEDRGEISSGHDPAWIADVLTAPLLMRGLLPGMPAIDDTLIAQTIDAALDALGYAGDRSAVAALREGREGTAPKL